MKRGVFIKVFSLRWWGIVGICFSALAMFVWFDFQNTNTQFKTIGLNNKIAMNDNVSFADISGNFSKYLVQEKNYTPVVIRGSIGFGMTVLLLSLIVGRRKEVGLEQNSTLQKHNLLDDNLPFGIAFWSNRGKLVGCNSHYRDRLKLSFKDVKIGACYIEIMNKIKTKNGYKIISDEELIRQLEITNDDGSVIFIDERYVGDDGFITIISDISEKTQLQSELKNTQQSQRKLIKKLHQETIKAEAASRSKTSFLAHLSHDVRTPLNHIIGFADLIAHQSFGPIGDKRYLSYIKDIKSSGEKLLISFSEILELAQLEGGNLTLRNEEILLDDLISKVANKYKARAKKAGIKLKINVCEETTLYIDRMCSERMIGNIVENAIQFTKKNGVININAWSADDGVVLEISDNGIGMSEEHIADLSQPFVLGDAAFTREGGVGLGIAISRAIAELAGGELTIDSNLAIGTSVAISLPFKACDADEGKVEQAA